MDVSIRESERSAQLHSFTKTNTPRATLTCVARNPSLTADELAHARAVARAIVDELGSQTAAVERLGVSKAALSDLLNGGSVGMKLVAALSRATGRSIDEVLGHASSGAPRVGRSELASLPVEGAIPGHVEPAARAISGAFAFPNVTSCVRVRESG